MGNRGTDPVRAPLVEPGGPSADLGVAGCPPSSERKAGQLGSSRGNS